ncbi:Putative ribosomal N-acetyltransferase YdaF [Lysinibacillus sphaericus]|nr:Putative ribosomal N-acetyltransferase YdaF [Lysinibacillus sphaericus]
MELLKRAELHDVKKDDLQRILKWRNQDFIREVMLDSEIISFEQHSQWFNSLQDNKTSITKIFHFNSIPYGVLNINHIDEINGTCEWGVYIGSKLAPKGIGSLLGYTALQYIFCELKIRKLSAKVLGFNERSISFHKKVGFTQEGLIRECVLKGGQPIDIILFGYLKSEWEEKYKILINRIEWGMQNEYKCLGNSDWRRE